MHALAEVCNVPNSVPGACHVVPSSMEFPQESRNPEPVHLAWIHRSNLKCIYLKKIVIGESLYHHLI